MDTGKSHLRRFHSLADAIAFISECIEANAAVTLFDATLAAENPDNPRLGESDAFVRFIFPAVQRQFQIMDFRARYAGRSFPEQEENFKLGGHDKELGYIHLDFLKRGDQWIIEKIWECR
jgi:hypothetical protein